MAEDELLVKRGRPFTPPAMDRSLGQYLLDSLRGHKNPSLQVYGPTGEKVSSQQVLHRALSVATELKDRGIRPDDVVVAAIENSLENAYVLLGTLFVGAIYAPVNPNLHPDDIRHMMDVDQPSIVLSAPRAVDSFRAALPPGVEVVAVAAEGAGGAVGAVGAEWARFLGHQANGSVQPPAIDLDSPALVMCSSGTTGAPKGVQLSHRNMIYFLELVKALEKMIYKNGTENERVMMVLPNFWISGLMNELMTLDNGVTLVLYPHFDIEEALGGVQRYKITATTFSPPQVVALAKYSDVERFDLSSLENIGCGGASLSTPVRRLAEKRLGRNIGFYYGQTECLLTMLPGPMCDEKPGCIGPAAPGMALKVIDVETGKAVGPNIEGELCLKGPCVFVGYRNNPEATAATIDSDGWLHTGDAVRYDEDGYFYICDRYKELVKYKGIHIAPAEVENILVSHSAVKDAAVVGIEHEEDQEHPVGFVVLKGGEDVNEDDLHRLVKDQLPEYKWLHGGIYFVKEIPRTPTGKIKRRELRQLARHYRSL